MKCYVECGRYHSARLNQIMIRSQNEGHNTRLGSTTKREQSQAEIIRHKLSGWYISVVEAGAHITKARPRSNFFLSVCVHEIIRRHRGFADGKYHTRSAVHAIKYSVHENSSKKDGALGFV